MPVEEPDAEAQAAARQREQMRHMRTAITLLTLVVLVVGGAWISWRKVTSSSSEDVSPRASCLPVAATAAPAPEDIQLNVYNSTKRSGLASSVAGQMQEHGFTVVDIANDPLDKTITGTAEVRSGPDQQAAASLVASMVPGSTYVADDRTTPTVDLVLGEAFEELGAPVDAAAASTLPPCAEPAS